MDYLIALVILATLITIRVRQPKRKIKSPTLNEWQPIYEMGESPVRETVSKIKRRLG